MHTTRARDVLESRKVSLDAQSVTLTSFEYRYVREGDLARGWLLSGG
jgi:hypothetical protein